jgi:hypothetical protein
MINPPKNKIKAHENHAPLFLDLKDSAGGNRHCLVGVRMDFPELDAIRSYCLVGAVSKTRLSEASSGIGHFA